MTNNDKTNLLLPLPRPFKDFIDAAATRNNQSTTAFIRSILAAHLDYDLTPFTNTLGRPRRYADAAHRQQEQNKRLKAERASATAILRTLMRESHARDVSALEQYLLRKGVSID